MTIVNDVTSPQALRQLLDLLARGAPQESFGRPALTLREAGADPADVALVEEATTVALAIRAKLEAHRHREGRLSALFDTAGDLAALRDLDSVLRAIVRRARMLVDTDVTYMTLNDPSEGDTYMRVTDGSVSAAFQQLRLGMGEGLGGLVAQTARPYASTDYRVDSRFRHTRTIDAGVDEEGLRGILGVPMQLGTRVIGVLYAADRNPREFTQDAIALLSSLADHAAVAIDGARMLEESRTALAELGAANETVRAHSEVMRRAAESHDRLTDLVLRGGDVTDVAREIAALLDGGLVVHDAHGTELARVGTDQGPPPQQEVRASRADGRAVRVHDAWVCAVLAGPELLGSLTLTGRPELSDGDRQVFERAGLVAALLLLLRRSVAEAEDRVRGELLGDLLADGGRDPGSLMLRARRLGVDLSAPHCVAVLHCASPLRPRLAAEATRQARRLSGLAGSHGGEVVLLAPADAPGALARTLAADVGRALDSPVTVGSGGPAASHGRLRGAHREALRCLQALQALGRTGEGGSLPELGFLGVLLGDRSDVSGYVQQVLGPVLDYDAQRGTELVRTLDAYYAQGASLARAKEELHVHVNTVVQRLDRVGHLLGEDWNAPDHALEMQLALRLHRLGGGAAPHR